MKEYRLTDWLPTTKKEVELRGWNELDVILFSGDAYVDHPSFGPAVIGRILEAEGLKVAIIPQPNWRDDLRDFKKLGRPRLFFGISAGCMDSMVNKYTANKRLRSEDAYTPDGRPDMRPEYPSIVYSQILKKLYPDVPVVLGSIEASMRRLSHYDYWQDKVQKSILCDSGADMLIYGMGEKPIVELVQQMKNQLSTKESPLTGNELKKIAAGIPQIAYLSRASEWTPAEDDIQLYYVSGRLKVAPEHTSDRVLSIMRKPSFDLFETFKKIFDRINREENLRQQLIPYFISSHPGCKEEDMAELAVITKRLDFHLEQVQDFTPTPMTVATEAWYTGFHPYTLEPIFSAKTQREKLAQRQFFFWYKPEERKNILNELRRIGRQDLIDKLYGKKK